MNIAKKLRKLFQRKKLKSAFKAIKVDMDLIEENHGALKQSVNEWVMFLDHENRDLKMRVKHLENKLDALDDSVDEERLAVLRSI